MPGASYEGPALDATGQHITEAPAWSPDGDEEDDGDELDQEAEDVVYATPPETPGEKTVENVPVPDGGPERPGHSGQTTLDEWGWSV